MGVVDIPLMLVEDELGPPAYARDGDAGADLLARTGVVVAAGGGRALVPTGVRLAIPDGYAGFVQPRSGLAWRHGITLVNSPGLIDAGYRDEISVIVINTDPVKDFEIRRGDRIAQLVVQRVERACFVTVGELPESDRGLGGFGHTGR
jgi:dUTP pyrophosphatase